MLTATPCALADGVTLEDASVWFAMTETSAQAYARAHAVWRQWLKHWHLTGDPRRSEQPSFAGRSLRRN
jgi:hypothetical protein